MGLLDLYSGQAGTNETPLQTLPRTLGERVGATLDETFSPDRYFTIAGARQDAWQKATDALNEASGQKLRSPYAFWRDPDEVALPDYEVQNLRKQKIIEARRNLLQESGVGAQLPDPERIDLDIADEARKRRETTARYSDTGNGFLNFLAGAALETATPHGVASLMLPVTRLPTAAAMKIGETFLGNVLKEGALQAGANAGLQAIAEGLDYATRSQVGTEQHLGEVAMNVGGAALLGFGIGAGARALHLKWLGLPEKVREAAPLEVRDAFKIIEADSIYSGRNRLGVDPLLHERYQERANDAILRGRPVELGDLTPRTDTALGQILNADRPPEINGLVRPEIGLPTHDAILRAVGNEDPKALARYQAVVDELTQIRGKLDKIEGDPAWVVTPGKPDAPTQRVLDDLEQQLAKAKSPDQQAAIADRIEGIREGLTPATAHRKLSGDYEELLAEADALMRQFKARATEISDAMVDIGAKLERPAAKDSPVHAAAELDQAMQAAEFARQARVLGHAMPSPDTRAVPTGTASPAPKGKPVTEPADIAPEIQKAMEAQAARALETGSLGDFKKAALKAIEDADLQAKDARAALNCAMGGL